MKENAIDQKKLDATSDVEFVFGVLFMIANRLQALLDREFQPYGLTARQWFLSIIVGALFEEPPTLGEAAAAMGTTHQNVKQVAQKLKDNGFLEFLSDERDGRAIRLRLTEKSAAFWAGLQNHSERFMAGVYEGLSPEELGALRGLLARVWANIEGMDENRQGGNEK